MMNWLPMSDSSDELSTVLGKVDTKKVCNLLAVIASSQIHEVGFIERRYTESARNFAETLAFLEQVSWITSLGGGLQLTPAAASAIEAIADERGIRSAILEAVISDTSPFRKVVAGYVSSFELEGPNLVRRPSLSERSRERPIRDFLMDLRCVGYRQSDDSYILDEAAAPLYIWAVNQSRTISLSTFAQLQRRREELGFAAEQVVLEYEKARLGSKFAERVEHISADSPFACYDIRSVTVDESGVQERYIEVKAVDPESLKFYWSKSEIDTAKVLRSRYFLYLLPYLQQGGFDTAALAIYCDPIRTLLSDRDRWDIEEDAVVCRKRQPPTTTASLGD
jgi:hypothetical protein